MCIFIRNIFIYGLVVLILPSTLGNSDEVTAADIEECGTTIFGRVECSSINFYRECIMPGAEEITAIKMHKNNTDNPCVFLDSFGFRSNSVWVTSGCGGEFYVCFTGEQLSTYLPVNPGSTDPPQTDGDVVRAATGWESNKVLIYIIIGVVILILFGAGLILGCVVKRRQQREKSRRIAAKRQIIIDQKRKHRDQQEGTILFPGVRTKSLSSENTLAPEKHPRSFPADLNDNFDHAENDREGSVCSSRSSNSGFTSVSCMTTGRLGSQSYNKRFSLDQSLLNGASAPDLRTLRGFSSEINGFTSKRTRHNKTSISGSQTSLESIREISNRYQLFEIPLERRLSKQDGYQRPTKYNTVGHSGRDRERSFDNGAMTLPSRRTVTAVVHAIKADSAIVVDEAITEENKPNIDGKKPLADGINTHALNEQGTNGRAILGRANSHVDISNAVKGHADLGHANHGHAERGSVDGGNSDHGRAIKTGLPVRQGAPEVPLESHYQDPQSLINSPQLYKYGGKGTPWSSIDEGIQKDMHDGQGDASTETFDNKQSTPIYATVNKRNKRVGLANVNFNDRYMPDNVSTLKHNDNNKGDSGDDLARVKTKNPDNINRYSNSYTFTSPCTYSALESFKPVENYSYHSTNFKHINGDVKIAKDDV